MAAMQDLVGKKLGTYELTLYLGEGAHVHAFLAKKRNAKKPVVIKVLKDTLAHSEEFFERFDKEAQAAKALVHPNIVKVLDYKHEGDIWFLVEEFKAGGSLMDIFVKKEVPLPMDRVVKTLNDVSAALDFAHERGIVHRDLKPENVLFDAEGNAAVSDLGITKTVNPQALRSKQDLEFGNPKYMSPEEWQGKTADARTDIYALGVILFEMLTGQLPFTPMMGDSFVYVHLMHMMSTPLTLRELRPDLPLSVDPVIARAIEKDPDQRFATAGELAAEFNDALEHPERVVNATAPKEEPKIDAISTGMFAAATSRTSSIGAVTVQTPSTANGNGSHGSTTAAPQPAATQTTPVAAASPTPTPEPTSSPALPTITWPTITRAEYETLMADLVLVKRGIFVLIGLLVLLIMWPRRR
jgi:eukaryotic-like serine/threonine-protein kinase